MNPCVKKLFQIATVVLLTLTNTSLSSYSIDDGILFRLNFQPSETAGATGTDGTASGDKSAVPSDESLLGTRCQYYQHLLRHTS